VENGSALDATARGSCKICFTGAAGAGLVTLTQVRCAIKRFFSQCWECRLCR